jgi:hypothetical protein
MQTKQKIDRPSHKALTGKIRKAIEALQAGKVTFRDPAIIAADLLNLNCEIEELPEILVELLGEIAPDHYAGTRPPQRSYQEDLGGTELYAFKKKSKRLGCLIYFKFALIDDNIWLVSFHEDKAKQGENKQRGG